MGMDADQAHKLAKRLLEIKPKIVKVSADTNPALEEIRRLEALKIDDKVFSIYTNHVDTFTRHGTTDPGFADGGFVRGPNECHTIPSLLLEETAA